MEALARHRFVGYVEDLIFTPALDFRASFSRDWQSSIEVSSAIGQTEAVRAGGGIGILHAFIAAQYDDLVPVLPALGLTRSYWIVLHEDVRHIRRVALVADFIARQAVEARAIFL